MVHSVRYIAISAIYLTTTLANSLWWVAPAHANPQGGHVVDGQASISEQGPKLDVVQHTDKAVIDWQDFSIGAGEHTQFHQPSSNATVLNRVVGNNLSDIAGTLSANGTVILVNRNGMVFRDGAQVNVGSLIASTADISNDRFMAGDMRFGTTASERGNPDAKIINHGALTAKEAGLVGLVAPQVENHGVISAKLGRVQLASGDGFAVDLSGRELVGITVSDEVKKQLVSNTGRIEAEGGQVLLTAAAGRELVDSLIKVEGEIHAPTAGTRQGVIYIGDTAELPRAPMPKAMPTRRVVVDGLLSVIAEQATERAGRIVIEGDDISLASRALLRATGYEVSGDDVAGGDVRIGGDYQGAPSDMNNARFLAIARGATIDASATERGKGGRVIAWSDGATQFEGSILARGGAQGGDGGFVEVSGKRFLAMNGTVDVTAPQGTIGDLLLDPGDIVVCQFGASSNAACNPSGSPSLVAAANIFDSGANATSYVNIGATGTAGTLLNLLNAANVTIRTNAGGGGNGDITIADAVSWTATRLLTLDAHRDIVVNANMTGNQMTFNPGRDLVLNANLIDSGTSTLTIAPRAGGATSMSIGSGTGTLNLTAAEWARINTGWNTFNIGTTAYTGSIALDSITSVNPLTVTTTGGAITSSGTVAMGANALTLTSGSIALGGPLTGTAALTIQPSGNIAMGIGTGSTGAFQLDDTELNAFATTFSGITLGRANSTADVDVRARTWNDPLTIRTGNANILVNGAQTMGANALTLTSRNLSILAGITGTGALTLQPDASTTVGIGTGATGAYSLDDTELNFLGTTFSGINIGNTASDANMEIRARTWQDPINFRVRNGTITVAGAQNFGANAASFTSRNIAINSSLTGTGALTLQPDTTATVGVGTGATGAYSLDDTELNFLGTTFSGITIGNAASDANMDVRARTWQDPLSLRVRNGTITINGAQTMGANALTLTSRNLSILAGITGTGALTLQPDTSTTVGVGTGAAGAYLIDDTELNFLGTTFSGITIGNAASDANMEIRARTWQNPVNFQVRNGIITVAGAQAFGANAASFTSRNIAINSSLTGTGALTLQPDGNVAVGVADGATGTYLLSTAELDLMSGTFSGVNIGRTNSTLAMDIRAYSNWRDPITFRTGTGAITVNGAQNFNANSATFSGRAIAFNSTVSNGNILTFVPDANVTMGVGTGQPGTLVISDTTLNNIAGTWTGGLAFGSTSVLDSQLTIGARTWNYHVDFMADDGNVVVAGAQVMTAGRNMTVRSDRDILLNAAITGTSTSDLTLTSANATNNIDIGTATANTEIPLASLNNITTGSWRNVIVGGTGNTGTLTVQGVNWNNHTILRSGTGAITIAGIQNLSLGHNLTIEGAGAMAINAALNGVGTLLIRGSGTAVSMVLGTTGGTINLDATELSRITDGWSEVQFGRTDSTQPLTVAGPLSWNDNTRFMTNSGVLTFSGTHNFNGNNAVFETNSDIAITGALSGTGALTIQQASPSTQMGIAGGAGVILSSAELNQIGNTFSSVTLGRSDGTAAYTVGAHTWGFSPTLINGTGGITFAGAQAIGANRLLARAFSTGNITLNAGATLTSSASGDAITLVSGGHLNNAAGASALTATGGRWLTYSSTLAGETTGGLVGNFRRFSCTYGGSCPALGTGNGQMYSNTPSITVNPTTTTITYGDTFGGTYTYAGTGYLNAADAAGDVLSGVLTGTSTYSAGNNVGLYNINYSTGTVTSAYGYAVTYGNNATALQVNKKSLTAAVNAPAAITYGTLTPTLDRTTHVNWAGFITGDDENDIDALTFDYGGLTAATINNAGTYTLGISAFSDGNYDLALPAGVTTGSFTINKKALTATVLNPSDVVIGSNVQAINRLSGVTWNGFITGENANVIDVLSFTYGGVTPGAAATSLGLYTLGIGTFSDGNYDLALPAGVTTGTLRVVNVPAPPPSSNESDTANSGMLPATVNQVGQGVFAPQSNPSPLFITLSDDSDTGGPMLADELGDADEGKGSIMGLYRLNPELRALLNQSAAQEF